MLRQRDLMMRIAAFLDVRTVLCGVGTVCHEWSRWVSIGASPESRGFWRHWARENLLLSSARPAATVTPSFRLSNFERGVVWQRLVLRAHPSVTASK